MISIHGFAALDPRISIHGFAALDPESASPCLIRPHTGYR